MTYAAKKPPPAWFPRTDRIQRRVTMSDVKMLIDGQLIEGDATLEVVNPATTKPFITVSRASEAQAGQAIAAAKKAQPGWAAKPIAERKALLNKLADAIDANADKLARTLTQEQGKPLADAQNEIAYTTIFLRYFAGMEIPIEIAQDDADLRVEVHHRPLGVVVGIAPWNFPVLIGLNKVGPALVLGNTMVLKPAPTTPAATLMVGEIAKDILPPGVLNIIADANDLGGYLTSHPDVAKVSFTGSTVTGKKVAASAASSLKRLTLELGGNDAGVVLDDVDVKKTARGVIDSAFMNAGQVCIALKRLYVPSAIYDAMCDELAILADETSYGDGLEQGVKIGPLQNAQQYEKAKRYLDDAQRDGKVIAGGAVGEGAGYFVKPTIVRDIAEGSPLVDEEQFAPILPVIRYDDLDDVITRANNSNMGLGGSVWSSSIDRAYEYAQRIDSGTIWINHHTHFAPHIPFGGAKESGIGVEFSAHGLAEYAQKAVISINKH
jgi:acyl-CoA reductase-like NAD-dependent aldehyde dehydrogenase